MTTLITPQGTVKTMSKYTTELRYIFESALGMSESAESKGVNEVIAEALPLVFDFDFPIFDEDYRSVLLTKIARHYWTREIGLETVGAWKMKFENFMNEQMPYYNQLYKSELLEFNPMYDIDYTRSGNRDGESNANANAYNSSDSTNKYSDTPQNGLSPIRSGEYLTSASIDENSSSSNSTSNATSTEEYLERVQGKMGGTSFSKMLQDFRKTFLNIDMEIINKLEPLFMQIW